METLVNEVRHCRLCAEHLPAGPRPVFQLHPQARILIAGQAPGRRVHESGVPFDDPSGKRLRAWLGVNPEQFYDPRSFAILPMGFCYPGTGKSGDLPPRPECAPAWRQRLLDSLPNLQLTLIIGQYALAWHLPECSADSLTEVAQDWQSYWPQKLPMPHPSPRNQRWLRNNPWFEDQVLPALQARVQELLDT